MSISFQKFFKQYTPQPIDIHTEAAVMVLMYDEDDPKIIFEKRSNKVFQGGDTSLIGGHVEKGEGAEYAVLRELYEESGIRREDIYLFGESDFFVGFGGLRVRVFIGALKEKTLDDLVANEEVEEFFSIPFSFFVDNPPQTFYETAEFAKPEDFPYHLIPGGRNYPFRKTKKTFLFWEYHDHVVWGMTAAMVHQLVKLITSEPEVEEE